MVDHISPDQLHLESLEVGAAPLVRLFLHQLDFESLLREHLPSRRGRDPALATEVVLSVLLSNLILARVPLYAMPHWVSRCVPEHLGLAPEEISLLNDDRIGRALDHLHQADRASLLTALVRQTVRAFDIDLQQLHQDTTTVTFSGEYRHQPPVEQSERAPRITFGFNKDHRPDLKQLLMSITISDDGAVPVHYKLYDGNTSDDQVHRDSWLFLREIIGSSDFLYVADSKLCSRENMNLIAQHQGRFLTVMPRTRTEAGWFHDYLSSHEVNWQEVHRQANPRDLAGAEIVYEGYESPQRSAEGYRILWYRSSQKQLQDSQSRAQRLHRARQRIEGLRPVGRGRVFRDAEQARTAGQRVLAEEGVEAWLRLCVNEEVETSYPQVGPGRPGEGTSYRRVERMWYRLGVEEDPQALAREALGDGLFPLMSNDEDLSVSEALGKYKYQPFVEKRHEQLKSVFSVMPVWLKSVSRVESLLWVYYAVELVQSLVERQLRRQMRDRGTTNLALYPEGRASEDPTTGLVLSVLTGHRRHRLLDEAGAELRRFHDPLSDAAQEVVEILGVDPAAYGIDNPVQ